MDKSSEYIDKYFEADSSLSDDLRLHKEFFEQSRSAAENTEKLQIKSGVVYVVEFSHRSGRDLLNMEKKYTNVIPIIEDARHPAKYRMLVGMVDVIFSDVAQPDQEQGIMNEGEQVALCWLFCI
ncbi:hypothetical protein AgCh_016178 [Apium graveolens]